MPPDAADAQRRAADANQSAWVSANAGAGKTTVLTSRVIRLLLAGADPAKILCVTFTKAAAANMQDRIFSRLGAWVALDDADLAKAITELEGRVPSPERLARARRLFAEAVETPGGLKIETIHAFCQRVLQLFPFEANVPARFGVLDDAEAKAIRERALTAVLTEGIEQPDSALGQAIRHICALVQPDALVTLLMEAMRRRRSMHDGAAPETKFAGSALHAALGIRPGETTADVAANFLAGGFPPGEWREMATRLAKGSPSRDVAAAAALTAAADALQAGHPVEAFEAFLPFLFTKEQKPCKIGTKWPGALIKAEANRHGVDIDREQARIVDLLERCRAIAAVERTEALTIVADAVLQRVEAEKRRLGKLDFDDQIRKLDELLSRDAALWVLFKLDAGLDHILVDEAQDTSPVQWRIIRSLTADFFSGEGARPAGARTVFAVGDEKQSIYSFQGAAPDAFDAARRHFHGASRGAGVPFEAIELKLSFRSVQDVLAAVDRVFELNQHRAGVTSGDVWMPHQSARYLEGTRTAPGHVELWPLIHADAQDEPDAWAPVDSTPASAPEARLARRIARQIQHWQATGARFEDDGRPIDPGDVLIVVRRRGAIFEQVLKALKEEGVPVAGADRLTLKDHIAVEDLLAAGRVALMPDDDLTLAAVLKSPLANLDDEDLITISDRGAQESLWEALQRHAAASSKLQAAVDLVHRLRAEAVGCDPFRFYGRLLGPYGGRRALLARLGQDAAEAIDVFLVTLRQWQDSHTPSLLHFLEFMGAQDAEVKRDLEEAHGRVRVMTAHAAKGLEARIVFLADTCGLPPQTHQPKLHDLTAPDGRRCFVWSGSKAEDTSTITAVREATKAATLAEFRRLLYVAMTRARDRLYVTGAYNKQAPAPDSWAHMIASTLSADGGPAVAEPAFDGEGDVQVWRTSPRGGVVTPDAAPIAAAPAIAMPSWLGLPPPTREVAAPPLAPSQASAAAERDTPVSRPSAMAEARRRGIIAHHLIERAHAFSPGNRLAALERLARARFPRIEPSLLQAVVADVAAVVTDSRLAPLFEPPAVAEVDLVGDIDVPGQGARSVMGRVDRLVVLPDRVIVADFKTGRPPRDARVPDVWLRQMAVYSALLADLHPDKPVHAWLVWTSGPHIVSLDPAVMLASLSALKPA